LAVVVVEQVTAVQDYKEALAVLVAVQLEQVQVVIHQEALEHLVKVMLVEDVLLTDQLHLLVVVAVQVQLAAMLIQELILEQLLLLAALVALV
jgi:hypothetical protein